MTHNSTASDGAIVVTGGTGFVGEALLPRLQKVYPDNPLYVLSRSRRGEESGVIYTNSIHAVPEHLPLFAIVNLAGAGIADKRWTERRKRELLASRVDYTAQLFEACQASGRFPRVMISASAIGFYGYEADATCDESTAKGNGFAARLCADWEAQSDRFARYSRLCKVRFGVVLGPGGALNQLLPIFRMGAGGPIAGGEQWFSWVERDDLVGLLEHLLESDSSRGVYNGTAPHPVRQKEFASELGRQLRRPAFMPTPAWALKLLYGQMAEELLIGGQQVVPAKALAEGFEFRNPTLKAALQKIFHTAA